MGLMFCRRVMESIRGSMTIRSHWAKKPLLSRTSPLSGDEPESTGLGLSSHEADAKRPALGTVGERAIQARHRATGRVLRAIPGPATGRVKSAAHVWSM